MRRFALAVLLLALAPSPALAQAPEIVQEPDRVVTAKKSVVDFTGVNVIGDLERPGGQLIWSRPKTKFRNLIELRSNFRPELARSASKLPGTPP